MSASRPGGGTHRVRKLCLQFTNDGAQKTRRQQPRPEGPGGILTERRKQSQGGPDERRHVAQLPTELLSNSDVLVTRGQTCCLGGIRGGTQGVRSHVGNGRALTRGSRGCGSGGS